jgi:hypothetical protein
MHFTSRDRFTRDGDWAQSDDVFRFAPRDAEILIALDADTLIVGDLEPLLNQIAEEQVVAGVIAHYPTYLPPALDHVTGRIIEPPNLARLSAREAWGALASGLVDQPLDFQFEHTLLDLDAPATYRFTPFYPNFGVVLFPRPTFDRLALEYLKFRPELMARLPAPDYAGQAALTLAAAAVCARTLALPLRYNFPNDIVAERMHPDEARQIVIFHYLRTDKFDRHTIFTTAQHYQQFLDLDLAGVNSAFQDAVRRIVGQTYPFA